MLVLLFSGIIACIIVVVQMVNLIFFHLYFYIVFFCAIFPLLFLVLSAFIKGRITKFANVLMDIKYGTSCPIYFHFEGNPEHKHDEKIAEMKQVIQRGDILLRRHKNYLSGIILGQTSYFTHAGLFVGVKNNVYQVMHSVGGKGVSYESIENFCYCEEFVLLRFFPNPACYSQQLQKLGKHLSFIDETERKSPGDPMMIQGIKGIFAGKKHDVLSFLSHAELDVQKALQENATELKLPVQLHVHATELDMLKEKMIYHDAQLFLALYNGKIQAHELTHDRFMAILLIQGEFLEGKPYDYNFNFIDDNELSCVEFVWYCYKPLAPLLQIKRNFFTYFGCIRAFVITPDMFLKNDFFSVQYSSTNKNEELLIRYAESNYFDFWRYYIEVVQSSIGLLVVFALLCFLSSTNPNTSPAYTNFILLAVAYFITVTAGKALSALDKLDVP